MKADKMTVATVVSAIALLLLISWAFYQTLQLDSGRKIKLADTPQKAVMAQAQAINEARLDELARSGKVTLGMSEAQVRNAVGEPVRTEKMEHAGKKLTVWSYEHDGWINVVFDDEGVVNKIERQP